MADNTNVEWGLRGYKGETGREYVLRTSHDKEFTRSYTPEGYGLHNQFFDVHSHPDKDGTKGGSGFSTSYGGDASNILDRYNESMNLGVALPPHYVYHKHSNTLYQYTPWESSIPIKKIKNRHGFNFLTPNRHKK